MKKLAVLMPTYNAEHFLKISIDSVLNQTYADFDLYIYDDCSVDNTEELITNYKDSRVFYRKNNINLGIAKTLNAGLEELLPKYKYIARMDADDWCYPERFEKQVEFLDKNTKVNLLGTQGFWQKDITQNNSNRWKYPLTHAFLKYQLLFSASFGHSSIMLRCDSFLHEKFKYDEKINTCEDWDLWIRVSKVLQIANLDDFLMKYRIDPNSNHRSSQNRKIHLEERSKIISEYWNSFKISISNHQVYEFYYDSIKYSDIEFSSILKFWIDVFNLIYEKSNDELSSLEQKQFSYLLSRRILDFWKRSGKSRWDLRLWYQIIIGLKVASKVKLIKSMIR